VSEAELDPIEKLRASARPRLDFTVLYTNPDDYDVASAIDGADRARYRVRRAQILPVADVPGDETHLVGANVMLISGVHQIRRVLQRNGKLPEPIDYPPSLRQYLGRSVECMPWGAAQHKEGRFFMKPYLPKGNSFDACLVEGPFTKTLNADDAFGLVHLDESTRVWVSDLIDSPIRSEWRCFITRGELVDVRKYNGDWRAFPDKLIVEDIHKDWKDAPAGGAFDVAVLEDGRTILVEVNDGWALGSYGLAPHLYLELLKARWEEMWKER
jgi:hypothetical protein